MYYLESAAENIQHKINTGANDRSKHKNNVCPKESLMTSVRDCKKA
jgi:hypothetical protein